MDKVRFTGHPSLKQGDNERPVTVRDLEAFKQELLNAFRSLLNQHQSPQLKKWLKTFEVKKLLDISSGTLQTLRNNGVIPFSKIGGIIYYDADEVNKVLETQKREYGKFLNTIR